VTSNTHHPDFRLQKTALFLGLALMGIKFAAWWFTNSNAILSDALESIINVLAGAFALYSLWIAAQPRDRNHPYGHGKIEFVSAGFEGGLIFLAGVSIIVKAAYNLRHPQQLEDLDLGLLLTLVTGGFNFFMGRRLLVRGKKTRSSLMQASGEHLLSDAWSSLGLILGLALVRLSGWIWLDSAIAIIFAGLIIYTGFRLLRSALAGIMDETDHDLLHELVNSLEAQRSPNWIDLHNLRVIKYGSQLHVDCHLTLPWYFSNRECHAELKHFDKLASEHLGTDVELFIHVDPCLPESCRICLKNDCLERQNAFAERINWTLENAVLDQKHT
jgi:cation diffusion facilitator family transporter